MEVSDLQGTYQFLISLQQRCQGEVGAVEADLLNTLQRHLMRDGYELCQIKNGINVFKDNMEGFGAADIHYLRGLSEQQESGGVNVLALIMVCVCIIFAGFASGLTQVTFLETIQLYSN